MIHFVIEGDGEVRPVCGEWGDVPNWTKIPCAATCQRCLARLGDDRETGGAGADPSTRPIAQIAWALQRVANGR
jgi:hypothetical protein